MLDDKYDDTFKSKIKTKITNLGINKLYCCLTILCSVFLHNEKNKMHYVQVFTALCVVCVCVMYMCVNVVFSFHVCLTDSLLYLRAEDVVICRKISVLHERVCWRRLE